MGTLSSDDYPGDTHTYTLTDNAGGRFKISGNDVQVDDGSLLNYEDATSHTVRVRSTDQGGLSYEKDIVISLSDVNEVPKITSTAPTSASKNAAYTYNITSDDPDAGETLTITGTTVPSWLTLTDNGKGTATLSGTPNNTHVGDHTIELQVKDADGAVATQSFTLKVKNTNETPTITGTPDTSFDEDTNYSFTPTANDADGDVLSFSIQNKPAWAKFDSTTGELSGTPDKGDLATTSNIVISVTDGTETVSLPGFNLSIKDVNDAPTNISPGQLSVVENSLAGTVVGTFSATDPDISDSHVFSLLNNADGAFKLSGNKLLVDQGYKLDYESEEKQVTIRVQTQDEGGLTYEKDIVVQIEDAVISSKSELETYLDDLKIDTVSQEILKFVFDEFEDGESSPATTPTAQVEYGKNALDASNDNISLTRIRDASTPLNKLFDSENLSPLIKLLSTLGLEANLSKQTFTITDLTAGPIYEVSGTLDIPDNQDNFFGFLKNLLRIDELSIKVGFNSVSLKPYVLASIDLKDITLFEAGDFSLELTGADLFAEAGVDVKSKSLDPTFSLTPKLNLANYDPTQSNEPDLELQGLFTIETDSIAGGFALAPEQVWKNPLGIPDTEIRQVAFELGKDYVSPTFTKFNLVGDLKFGDIDIASAFAIDVTDPKKTAVLLTLNDPVAWSDIFSLPVVSYGLGQQKITKVIEPVKDTLKLLADFVDIEIESLDADGDGQLDPLIKLVPESVTIAGTTVQPGFALNGKFKAWGAEATIAIEGNPEGDRNFTGSLQIPEIDLDWLKISGANDSELNLELAANPFKQSFSGDASVEILGQTIAKTDFSVISDYKQEYIEIDKFNVNLGIVGINAEDVSGSIEGKILKKLAGKGSIEVFGDKVDKIDFAVTPNSVTIKDFDIGFGKLLSLDIDNLSVDSSGFNGSGAGKIKLFGQTLGNAKLEFKNGILTVSGSLGVDVLGEDIDLDVDVIVSEDIQKIDIGFDFLGSDYTLISASIDDFARKFTSTKSLSSATEDIVWGAIGNVAGYVKDLLEDGIRSIADVGSAIVDGDTSAFKTVVDFVGDLFDNTSKRINYQGDERDNKKNGNDNKDVLFGNGGNDTLHGRLRPDLIDGGSGHDRLLGGNGNDTINGGDGNDYVYGQGHQDLIYGWDGHDSLQGAGDRNQYNYSDKRKREDRDTIYGGQGDDIIWGEMGNDYLYGNAGRDELYGGEHHDVLSGGPGRDYLDGGDGYDTAEYSYATVGIDANLASDRVYIPGEGTETIRNIEYIKGGSGNDTLKGDSGYNKLYGRSGDDWLNGGAGGDDLYGGPGDDWLNGGAGGDYLYGGPGSDTADYSDTSTSIEAQLNSRKIHLGEYQRYIPASVSITGASTDYIYSIENIIAGSGNDTLYGNHENNYLSGGDGNDSLLGGHGDDILSGGRGIDYFDGGPGIDTADFSYTSSSFQADLSQDQVTFTSGTEESIFYIENIIGGGGNDTLIGDSGKNILSGGQGNDSLLGGGGNDVIIAGTGRDTIDGGSGTDVLVLEGRKSDYTFTQTGQGWRITSGSTVKTVKGIEEFQYGGQYRPNSGSNAIDFLTKWQSSLFGSVIDGYIAGGEIFFDANLNGIRDEDEPYSFTGGDGSFDLGIDLDLYDLNQNGVIDHTEGKIIVNDGIDTSTGLLLETPLSSVPGSEVVTPLTTIIAELVTGGSDPETAQTQVKAALGLPEDIDLSSYDPLEAITRDDANGAAVFAKMVQVQNVIVQASKLVGAGSSLSISEVGSSAIAAIAQQIQSGETVDLSNPETITTIISATATATSAADSNLNAEQLTNVAATAASVIASGNQLIDEATQSGADLTEIATNITRVQSVSQAAEGLQELATGQVSAEEFQAANTVEAIQAKAAVATVNDPTATQEIDLSQLAGDSQGGTGGNNLSISFPDNSTEQTETTAIVRVVEELETLMNNLSMEMPANNPPDDVMVGDASANSFMGYEGNDYLLGMEGDDVMQGNQHQDMLNGNQGNDTIYGGKDDDLIRGGKDDDVIYGDLGNDSVCGDLGNDTVYGGADNDIVLGFEGDDLINGNQGDDTVYGGEGNDWAYGGQGDDIVCGGLGNDTVSGDLGNDTLCGGAGTDYLSGGTGEDVFILASGQDTDIITDFIVGEDKLYLGSTLTFDDLTFAQGINEQAGDTLIRLTATGELLASLTGVSVGVITADAIV